MGRTREEIVAKLAEDRRARIDARGGELAGEVKGWSYALDVKVVQLNECFSPSSRPKRPC